MPGSPTDVTRNLAAESQFGVNSSHLYGVVDLPGGPNMRQTHNSVVRLDYLLNRDVYTQCGDTALSRSGSPLRQPLKMFQFIVGKFNLHLMNQIIYLHLFFIHSTS